MELLKSELLETYTDEQTYTQAMEEFIRKADQAVIPVFIKGRNDLEESIRLSKTLYAGRKNPNKVDVGIRLSPQGDIEMFSSLESSFADNWYELEDLIDLDLENKSVVVMGLYKDFKYDNLKRFIFKCYQEKVQVSYLIGRDTSSLSWLCAKQFLKESKGMDNGLVTHRKINQSLKTEMINIAEELLIYDKAIVKKHDMQLELLENNWSKLILHGHGKEDNINFEDYTICGRNDEVVNQHNIFPRCGYCEQSCFKDDQKLIPLNRVKAANVIMASCNNGPFADMALYDDKYNLLLNAIDSPAQNITAAVTIQDSDLLELKRLVDFTNPNWNPARIINDSLDYMQPFPSMIEIGLPVTKDTIDIDIIEPSNRIIRTLERAQKYYTNDFIDENHSLKKLLPNFINKGNQYVLRGQYGLDAKEKRQIENNWKQKIQALNDIIATTITEDPDDPIMEFDGYNVYRSKVDVETIKPHLCNCGQEGLSYLYKGHSSQTFDLKMEFCFRCGDKSIGMAGGPKIAVNVTPDLKVGERIKGVCTITPEEEGEIMVGWFVPNYIKEYLIGEPALKRFKNKNKEAFEVELEFEFRNDIPAQGYYFTVFTVQNLGITINRHFFTLEGKVI
ncbi:hypothetical protein ABEW00_17315 [Rossellomorea vietnamensis]|uniref:hypothetical protein n=1 Tax=Rossellomorea vietnamensis TaxID=218284 RepID=UPI003D290246